MLLADSGKFGQQALARLCGLGEVGRGNERLLLVHDDALGVKAGALLVVRLQGPLRGPASLYEQAYLSIFERLCVMVADSTFPFRSFRGTPLSSARKARYSDTRISG